MPDVSLLFGTRRGGTGRANKTQGHACIFGEICSYKNCYRNVFQILIDAFDTDTQRQNDDGNPDGGCFAIKVFKVICGVSATKGPG